MDLYTACTLNHPKVIELLSGNLNTANKKGWTYLMYACYYGNEMLVDRIVNTDPTTLYAINKDKQTPLMIAVMSGNTTIVEKTFCIDVMEKPDKLGRTAMFYAVLYNQCEILEFFIEKGADCDVIDKFGKTMTMTAISKGFRRVMLLLSEYCNRQGSHLKIENKNEDYLEFNYRNVKTNKNHYLDYQLEKLLKQLSLEKYWPIFDEKNLSYDDFLKLTEEDLKNIGINLFGPRRKLIMTIYKLNELRTSEEYSRS